MKTIFAQVCPGANFLEKVCFKTPAGITRRGRLRCPLLLVDCGSCARIHTTQARTDECTHVHACTITECLHACTITECVHACTITEYLHACTITERVHACTVTECVLAFMCACMHASMCVQALVYARATAQSHAYMYACITELCINV